MSGEEALFEQSEIVGYALFQLLYEFLVFGGELLVEEGLLV